MLLSVSQELRQPVGTEFEMDIPTTTILLPEAALTDLQGGARLLRTDRGLLIQLRADARFESVCSRCLAPSKQSLTLEMEEEFIPLVDPLSGRHITGEEAEESFVIDEDLRLDLGEALRQYALMTGPSKPLCQPDCAGLCPTCGANLNEGACSCQPRTDERWAVLAALKRDDTERS